MKLPFTGTQPTQANPNDAGYDLRSSVHATIRPNGRALIKTNLKVAIPPGYAGLVCSRSGLAAKYGVFVLNAPGVVDHGYTGEVGVILENLGDEYFDVNPGDRIAQLLIIKIEHPEWEHVAELDATERGDGGFGSTGLG